MFTALVALRPNDQEALRLFESEQLDGAVEAQAMSAWLRRSRSGCTALPSAA